MLIASFISCLSSECEDLHKNFLANYVFLIYNLQDWKQSFLVESDLVSKNHATLFWICSALLMALTFSLSLLKLFLNRLLLKILAPNVAASSMEMIYSEEATHYLNLYLSIILLTIFLTLCNFAACLFPDLTAIAFCLDFCVFKVLAKS
jgi:hypothetical protein